jgi:hypothetical protein
VSLGEWFMTFSRHSDPSKQGDSSFNDMASLPRKSESLSTGGEYNSSPMQPDSKCRVTLYTSINSCSTIFNLWLSF